MGKKIITVGVVLLIAAAATFCWGLSAQKRERQLLSEIKARLDKLDTTVTDEISIRALADIFSSEDWKQRFNDYNSKMQTHALLLDTSVIFLSVAVAVFLGWLILWGPGQIKIKFTAFKEFARQLAEEHKRDKKIKTVLRDKIKDAPRIYEGEQAEKEEILEKHSQFLIKSGWHNFTPAGEQAFREGESEKPSSQGEETLSGSQQSEETVSSKLLGEHKTLVSKKKLKLRSEMSDPHEKALRIRKAAAEGGGAARLEKVISDQKESLDRQVAEFREMAEEVKKAAMEHSQPLGETIKELILQVSAIRDYALNQQERIKRLQEGYDWNIIKNFSLRVIRCIDNINERIEDLESEGLDATVLEEIKEELIFGLESGGIEQYQPQLDSDYSGQERVAEAVPEREACDSEDQRGKIARVMRPGYRHFIDDEHFKVVRAARVKLYG